MDKFTLPKSGAAVGDFGYDLPHTMDGLHHAIHEALDLIVEMKAELSKYKVMELHLRGMNRATDIQTGYVLDMLGPEWVDLDKALDTAIQIHASRSTEGSSND